MSTRSGNRKLPCIKCKKPTTLTVSHFWLTNEYTRDNKSYPLCRACKDALEFNYEIRKQMREADGDYEE